MAATVLRLPRVDAPEDESDFVLLNVTSTGKHALDLKLIGTENQRVFSVSIKHKEVSSFRTEKFTGSEDQFEKILSGIFLGADIETDQTQGIEAIAKVTERKPAGEKKNRPFLNITIQRRIEGITQKYAEIELPRDKSAELDIFDWCAIAVESQDEVKKELHKLKTQLRNKEEETNKLNEALADLVKVKNAHENELIEKFSLLLNEKKLKIRDQQRLLASATVDPEKLAAVEQSRSEHRSPGPSRAGKRKGAVKEEDDESDDGFEKMEVDAKSDSGGEEPPETPDQSTADEDSEGNIQPVKQKIGRIGKPKQARAKSPVIAPSETPAEEDLATKALPPRRELPFARKKAPEKPMEKSEAETSETESDDEL